jgi:hypothetical protein
MEGTSIIRLIIFVMVGVIVATITLAAISYGAFRMRERRRPRALPAAGPEGLLFFERVDVVPPRRHSAPDSGEVMTGEVTAVAADSRAVRAE